MALSVGYDAISHTTLVFPTRTTRPTNTGPTATTLTGCSMAPRQ